MDRAIMFILQKYIDKFKRIHNRDNKLCIDKERQVWYEHDMYVIYNESNKTTTMYTIDGIIALVQSDKELLSKIIKLC